MGGKTMRKKFGLKALSVLIALLLMSISLMPAVSAQVDGRKQTHSDVGQVVMVTSPEIKIIENTHTSCIVEMGNVRISLTSNPEHTAATLIVLNTTTHEQHRVDYKTSVKSGSYITQTTIDGKPGSTYTTSYDPFEPGSAKNALETDTKASAASVNPVPLSYTSSYDGVIFDYGSGIKYPHPDYASYGAYAYESFYIVGNNLNHRHIAQVNSNNIAAVPAAAAGVIIATYFTANPTVGLVVGAVLAAGLGSTPCSFLLDEQGCIWEWDAQSWGTVITIVPPSYAYYVPKYERIGPNTLWNVLGISDP
jgi:hypothetical protein